MQIWPQFRIHDKRCEIEPLLLTGKTRANVEPLIAAFDFDSRIRRAGFLRLRNRLTVFGCGEQRADCKSKKDRSYRRLYNPPCSSFTFSKMFRHVLVGNKVAEAYRDLAGAPGMGFAPGSPGGLSSARKAKRSARSFRSTHVSMPSGIIESLLTRVYLTLLRGTASSPSPGILMTTRWSLSSTTRPVRLRPSLVTTVTV